MANSKISALTSATTPLAGTETLPVVQSSTTKQVSVANLTAGRAVSALSYSSGSNTGTTTSVNTNSQPGTIGTPLYMNYSFYGYLNNELARIRSWDESGSTGYGYIELLTAPSYAAAPTIKVRVGPTGDVTNLLGNFIQGTAAKGFNFTANTPASGMTSQLLNWYEEGTWTPTDLSGAGLTFSSVSAKYTRVGRLVTVELNITFPITASVATVQLGGLPFTPGSNGAGSFYSNFAAGVLAQVGSSLYLINAATPLTNANMSNRNMFGTCTFNV